MEQERDIHDAPLETRDQLVLKAMQTMYRELKRRPYWYPGYGLAHGDCTRADLLQDWMVLANTVRWEIDEITALDDSIPKSDWPDVPACLLLGLRAFLERSPPRVAPDPLVVETWKLACCFLTMGLIEERQQLMGGYLSDFIHRARSTGRMGPVFDPQPMEQGGVQ